MALDFCYTFYQEKVLKEKLHLPHQKTPMNTFTSALKLKLDQSQNNNYGIENYDEDRFGPLPIHSKGILKSVKEIIKGILGKSNTVNSESLESNPLYQKYGNDLEKVYSIVSPESKKTLVELIAFRLLGYTKVKLSLNTEEYWKSLQQVEELLSNEDTMDPNFLHFVLRKIDLKELGYDFKMYYHKMGVLTDFVVEQYAYNVEAEEVVKVEEGDYVIDAGACWADTALYFAEKAGPNGKVFSFEFIPGNIKIFNANLDLNPSLKERVTLVQQPVSNVSNLAIYYEDRGPASKVELNAFDSQTGTSSTIAIDDFVRDNEIEKIDFIKMDIEGAEPLALEGAIETIKKHKPKLAIAIYHNMDDMVNIAQWINNLDLGYKLAIKHNKIHAEETILFGKVKKNNF